MRIGLRLSLVLVAAVTVLGCPEQTAVWVEDGSTATDLIFGVGRYRDGRGPPLSNLPTLVVQRCTEPEADEDVVWQIAIRDIEAPVPARIRYGEPPPGYYSMVGPGDLTPGCYEADILGSGRVGFAIAPDGSVTTIGTPSAPLS
jgi:hypothetical protein